MNFWEKVKIFFKGFKMCRGKNHKCACKSNCCNRASLVVAYDERGSSDDSDSDISITPEVIKVK